MLLAIAVALIFFGCEKEAILPLESGMDDQETTALKAAKDKVKRTFEGICTPVDNGDPNVNEWYDDTDDWRTTGTTIWEFDPNGGFFGTAVLTVEAKNPHEDNRGIWEMEWSGEINFVGEVMVIAATATGVGVEGKVKGMKANWTYTMNYVGTFPPLDVKNPTCFYTVEGNIVKPQGPIKHMD
ncbi:MAG: hypothetical protein DRI97_13645 [Bacteroidetes bacterium]|nr:MAG: hypothetical protein DRI97_13645 [Bacteroidota bacterium]